MADALGPNETEAIIRPHPDVPQELGNHLHVVVVVLTIVFSCIGMTYNYRM